MPVHLKQETETRSPTNASRHQRAEACFVEWSLHSSPLAHQRLFQMNLIGRGIDSKACVTPRRAEVQMLLPSSPVETHDDSNGLGMDGLRTRSRTPGEGLGARP